MVGFLFWLRHILNSYINLCPILLFLAEKPFQSKIFKHLNQNPTLWFFFQGNDQDWFFLVLDDEAYGGAWIEVRDKHRIEFYIGFGLEFLAGFTFSLLFCFCHWNKNIYILYHTNGFIYLFSKWLLSRINSLTNYGFQLALLVKSLMVE